AVDLCHAASGGPAALPGLLAHHFFGVPLLVTEYGVRLRTHYLTRPDASPAVRSLLAALHGRLAGETYRRATVATPGHTHARPPLAGALRGRPRQAAHGVPRHGRGALRRGGRVAGVRRPAHPGVGRPYRTGQGPRLPAARLRRRPQGGAPDPPARRRRPGGRGG